MMIERQIARGRSPGPRELQPGRIARLMIVDADSAAAHLVVEVERLIEAPNWTPDGRWLLSTVAAVFTASRLTDPGLLRK
jgi:Tol biopolymer transport system component